MKPLQVRKYHSNPWTHLEANIDFVQCLEKLLLI